MYFIVPDPNVSHSPGSRVRRKGKRACSSSFRRRKATYRNCQSNFKKASIIYADEPTASLDANNREMVITLLRQCAKQGTIVVLATHDDRLVQICDKVVNMEQLF